MGAPTGDGYRHGMGRLRTVRVRTIELRILGVALSALWFVVFLLLLASYHPGGPADLAVSLAAVGPILVALASVAWPPVTRGDRAFAAIAWLALAAGLLLLPSIASVVSQLPGLGPPTLLPSAESAYPWLLALIATSLFAGLGIARKRLGETAIRRRRLVLGSGLALLMVLGTGSAFAATAIVNELALSDRPAIASRFGPTDPALDPPDCSGILVAGTTARLELRMDAAIDTRRTGQVSIEGVRSQSDVRWTGFAATGQVFGQLGVTRIGSHAWRRRPGTDWAPVPVADVAGYDLDRQLVLVAFTDANRSVAEDRGIAYVEGARARHCRITIDGDTLRRALPEIGLLIGQTDIARWRADLDYWVFADQELGQVDGRVTGPAGGLAEDALLATVRFRLTAVDRGRLITIPVPVR
jgi:hypothetical protein